MAYVTGSVSSGQDLFNIIITSMTDNGWTLHDTLNIADKVLYSSGTDGYTDMYIRVRNSATKLNYDAETSGFIAGETVIGGTSGALALIVEVIDLGTTGTLKVVDIVGSFLDNEAITSASGAAVMNGVPQFEDNASPLDLDNLFNCIYFTAYSFWNSVTNTGLNERFRFGPYNMYGIGEGTSPPTGYSETVNGIFAVYSDGYGATIENNGILWIKTDDLFPRPTKITPLSNLRVQIANSFAGMTWHDSYRKYLSLRYIDGTVTNAFTYIDIPRRVAEVPFTYAGSIANTAYMSGITIHKKNENKTYRFYYNTIGTSWRMVDIDTGEESIVSTNPFTATNISSFGCRMAYDGNKYVYAILGSSLELRRFDLDTNTWSALLATPPFALSVSGSSYDGLSPIGIFIPANTVSGGGLWAEDRILFQLNSGTPTYLHAYNIGSNTWTSNAITLPAAFGGASQNTIYCDGNTVYYGNGQQALVYKIRLSSINGTWSIGYRDARWQYAQAFANNTSTFSPRVSKIQYSNESFSYGIMVDEDKVVVWTGPNNQYYWAYAGNYNKSDTALAAIIGNYSAGQNVEVSVSNTTDFEEGNFVNILNSGTGSSTLAKILSLTDKMYLRLNSSISDGDLVFRTASDFIITGDTELGITMYDQSGVFRDTIGQNDIILEDNSKLRSPINNKEINISPLYIMWPFNQDRRASYKGELQGVYSVNGDVSALPDRSILRDKSGNAYILIKPYKRKITQENSIAIGPIV